MESRQGYLIRPNGEKVYAYSWAPKQGKGTILIQHGFSEYGGNYRSFAERYTDQGFNIYSWDMRGHGKAPGKRGCVRKFQDFCDDLKFILNHAQSENQQKGPVFLLGHSMGGVIALLSVLQGLEDQIDGLILSAPAMKLALDLPLWKLKMSPVARRFLPQFTFYSQIPIEDLVSVKEVREEYYQDQLRQDRCNSELYFGLLESADKVEEQFHKLELPMLILQAGKDVVVDNHRARRIFEKSAKHPRSQLKIYPQSFHEVLRDCESETAHHDIQQFLGQFF